MEFTLNKNYNYAIVGASNNPEKYGFKVTKDLKDKNFSIFPVNLKAENILNLKTYSTISDISKKIDVVISIVPPQITEKILKEVKKLKIDKVWMQPGSESKKAIKFCLDNNIKCIHDSCIMIKSL